MPTKTVDKVEIKDMDIKPIVKKIKEKDIKGIVITGVTNSGKTALIKRIKEEMPELNTYTKVIGRTTRGNRLITVNSTVTDMLGKEEGSLEVPFILEEHLVSNSGTIQEHIQRRAKILQDKKDINYQLKFLLDNIGMEIKVKKEEDGDQSKRYVEDVVIY